MATVGWKHRSLREEVIDELRRMILDGDVVAGAHLTEAAIAERLGVSRLPVREAFRVLESEGLLESLPRRGMRVVTRDDTELVALHEIRVALELIAVRHAAQCGDTEVVSEMAEALDRGEQATKSADMVVLEELNDRFHELLARASGSRILADTLRSVRNQAHLAFGGKHSRPDVAWAEHSTVMKAVVDRDGEMAQVLMRRHLDARHGSQLPQTD
jgi:DNA-binding GntR family transcriptional regulator